MTLVLAGYREEFVSWCRRNGVDPAGRDVKFVRSMEDALGFGPPTKTVRTGRWWRADRGAIIGFEEAEKRIEFQSGGR